MGGNQMKNKIIAGAILALSAVIVLECGRKKSADPVGVILDAATERLKAAKDGKSAAAAVDALVVSITALKEKSPDILKDRTNFKDADEEFIRVYADAMIAHMGNEDFAAAEKKLMPLGVLH